MPRSRWIYEDSGHRRLVDNWKAVDVQGEDGLFQHGTIVDLDPDGLVVDFGCAGQRRQLVEYGKAFRYMSNNCGFEPGCVVEVLLRLGPQRPWVWLPAKVLIPEIPERIDGVLAFVDVSRDGVVRHEVVAYEQIRLPVPPSSADLDLHIIRQGDFVIGSVCPRRVGLVGLMPASSVLSFCRQLRQNMSDWYKMWPIYISSEQLLFLQFSPIGRSMEDIIRSAEGNLRSYMRWYTEPIGRCGCWPALSGGGAVETSCHGWEWSLQHLPKHLLEKVFSHLDTMQRAAHRRVCGTWDALLCEMLSVDIQIGREPCRKCTSTAQTYYHTSAPLFKVVTRQTRRITLINAHPHILCDVLRYLTVIGDQLGRCAAGQTVTVVAFQCGVGRDDGYAWEHAEYLALSMGGGWCRRLLLQQCTISSIALVSGMPGLRFSGVVGWGSVQEDLWKAAEKHLPEFDDQRVAQWVAQAVHRQSAERSVILEVLNDFTTPQHPPLSDYHRQVPKWTAENLAALEVHKLPRLHQYAISLKMPPNLFDSLPGPGGPDAM